MWLAGEQNRDANSLAADREMARYPKIGSGSTVQHRRRSIQFVAHLRQALLQKWSIFRAIRDGSRILSTASRRVFCSTRWAAADLLGWRRSLFIPRRSGLHSVSLLTFRGPSSGSPLSLLQSWMRAEALRRRFACSRRCSAPARGHRSRRGALLRGRSGGHGVLPALADFGRWPQRLSYASFR